MSVIAYHLIWTNYGTWLPNDLRGSGSRCVYTPVLAELGAAHFGRKKIQPARSLVRAFYDEAEPRLQFPVVRFDANEREIIGSAFADTILSHRYTCYACAIMPDHVHLVIRKHKHTAETIIHNFQQESRLRFSSLNAMLPGHRVWTNSGWKVYLDSPEEVWPRIRYVENNPRKEHLPSQRWSFVVPYDNWPFHKGAKPQAINKRSRRGGS
jgi:REP element-mobilizing transposase RayT